jgi:hypothetical protein
MNKMVINESRTKMTTVNSSNVMPGNPMRGGGWTLPEEKLAGWLVGTFISVGTES